jgi:myo-inositol 2-dehydrogenase / D-chiro-inositol 1-dehydrogenase
MTVRTGVIGTGVMGAAHARWLAGSVSGCELTAVYDIDAGQADSVATECGARMFDDPVVLIKDDDVDAVLVASSDATHEQFVLACLAAGKPVLCEKPLAPDVAGCERVLAAQAEAGASLTTVGFMRRYDAGYLAMRDVVQDGSLGRPLVLHCVHRNASPVAAASSTTLITSSAVHEFDVVHWLLDEEIATVTVHRSRPASAAAGTQDPMLLVLTTASGAIVSAEVFTTAAYGYEVRCELVAERGTLLLDDPAPVVLRRDRQAGRGLPADWIPRFAQAYQRELQDWIQAVAVEGPARGATAWDGYLAALVSAAAVAALETGLPQHVRVPERPALYR